VTSRTVPEQKDRKLDILPRKQRLLTSPSHLPAANRSTPPGLPTQLLTLSSHVLQFSYVRPLISFNLPTSWQTMSGRRETHEGKVKMRTKNTWGQGGGGQLKRDESRGTKQKISLLLEALRKGLPNGSWYSVNAVRYQELGSCYHLRNCCFIKEIPCRSSLQKDREHRRNQGPKCMRSTAECRKVRY
jgi:hypothetical protein